MSGGTEASGPVAGQGSEGSPGPASGAFDADVLVVGASAAGLRCAELLARGGAEVLVLERRGELGDPARTWIVTREIDRVLGFHPEEAVVHETGTMELASEGGERERVPLDPPDLIVERRALLRLLADRAREAGAEVRRGVRATGLARRRGRVEVAVETGPGGPDGTLAARHLVGADGTRSWVAGRMGAAPQPAVPVLQARVPLPEGRDPDVTTVWFERDRTRFFGWLIPEGSDVAAVGLIADGPDGARRDLDGLLAARGFPRGNGGPARGAGAPLEYQGALIPLYRRDRRVEWTREGSRVLLVGDAAGQVKVTTVGGVVTGLWGARAAATALLEGTSYRQEASALRRELDLHGLVRRVQNGFRDRHYDQLLRLLRPELKDFLARRNRDSMAEAPLRLVALEPRLLWLGAKAVAGAALRNGS